MRSIDAPDYNVWRDNFGRIAGGGVEDLVMSIVTAGDQRIKPLPVVYVSGGVGAGASVPEPSCLVLLAVVLLLGLTAKRRC